MGRAKIKLKLLSRIEKLFTHYLIKTFFANKVPREKQKNKKKEKVERKGEKAFNN